MTRVAISTMTFRAGSSPVISRSIHTSTRRDYWWARGAFGPVEVQTQPGGMGRAVLEVPLVLLDPNLPAPSFARQAMRGPTLA